MAISPLTAATTVEETTEDPRPPRSASRRTDGCRRSLPLATVSSIYSLPGVGNDSAVYEMSLSTLIVDVHGKPLGSEGRTALIRL
jgi:hypothetical protein